MRSSNVSIAKFAAMTLAALFGALFIGTDSAEAQSPQQLAHMKSQRMAQVGFSRLRMNRPSRHTTAMYGMRHVMPFRQTPQAAYEGVGYSPYSAEHAVQNACRYGTRAILAQSVVQGRDGFYATVYYH